MGPLVHIWMYAILIQYCVEYHRGDTNHSSDDNSYKYVYYLSYLIKCSNPLPASYFNPCRAEYFRKNKNI